MEKKVLELYVHIPFCVRKCAYCDFLSWNADAAWRQEYVETLVCEIQQAKESYKEYRVTTIFLGGGTPSILSAEQIERIFRALRENFRIEEDAEITIEANPGTVTAEKAETWKRVGINRVSIGLQSAENRELKMLGRIHTYEEFLDTYRLLREKGFCNLNVDLISAIPGQSVKSWERTLRKVADLSPEHISAYSLIIEEGTPFYDMYQKGIIKETEENLDRDMYYLVNAMLKENGYHRYEISNFAKKGFECEHNKVYWRTQEYKGFGLGAHSYMDGRRFHNTYDFKEYIEEKVKPLDMELLSDEEKEEEFMFMGLRMTEGISKRDFRERFKTDIYNVYGEELKTLIEEKLINEKDDRIFLSERGIDISNQIFEKFVR